MLAQILGAQQSLLLRGHRRKQDRAPRLLRSLGKGMRQFEQNAATGRIVVGAVVDVVARHFGTNAQVIVVRGIHHRLIL